MFLSFTGDIDSFCRANPGAVKPVDTNCAQYYKCPNAVTGTVKYVQVCICLLGSLICLYSDHFGIFYPWANGPAV